MAKAAKKSKTRRPGAGRKPQGNYRNNTVLKSLRLNHDLCSELEAAAEARGWSFAQMAMETMKLGLEQRRRLEQPSATQTLMWLIGHLSDKCSVVDDEGELIDWTSDQFTFDALAKAIALLMARLRPEQPSTLKERVTQETLYPGETNADFPLAFSNFALQSDVLANPDNLAQFEVTRLLRDLEHIEAFNVPSDYLSDDVVNRKIAGKRSEYTYQISKARRLLGIGKDKP